MEAEGRETPREGACMCAFACVGKRRGTEEEARGEGEERRRVGGNTKGVLGGSEIETE